MQSRKFFWDLTESIYVQLAKILAVFGLQEFNSFLQVVNKDRISIHNIY